MRRNRYIERAFIIMAAAVSFIFLFSFGGAAAYEAVTNPEERLPAGTIISGMNVGGMKLSEAEAEVEAAVSNWQTRGGVTLALFDEQVLLDNKSVRFDVPETIDKARSGGEMPVEAHIPAGNISAHLQRFTYEELASRTNTEQLSKYIVESIRLNKGEIHQIDIGRFLQPPDKLNHSAFNTVTISDGELSSYVREWGEALNGYTIEANSEFSLIRALEESGAVIFDDPGLNMIASSVFQLLAESNFVLSERHIHDTLPSYVELGQDAEIRLPSRDLRFYNPNIYDYELRVEVVGNQLNISLFGYPFFHEYHLLTKNKESISPRTLVRFNPDRLSGDRQLITSGREGVYGEIVREVRTDEALIEEVKLDQDYYPPKHRIEEWSLQDKNKLDDEIPEENWEEGGNGTDGDTEEAPDNNYGNGDTLEQGDNDSGSSGTDEENRTNNHGTDDGDDGIGNVENGEGNMNNNNGKSEEKDKQNGSSDNDNTGTPNDDTTDRPSNEKEPIKGYDV